MSSGEADPSSNGHGSNAWTETWTHCRIDRPKESYCRVTFDHPPTNTITARTVAELGELVGLVEDDPDLNVIVFRSANRAFFLTTFDGGHDLAWVVVLRRLSQAPVVSIASIRGSALGAGEAFVLACDLRFASRQNTRLGNGVDGARAEQLGYVNRLIDDDELDAEVDVIASRIAHFDLRAIARMKRPQI